MHAEQNLRVLTMDLGENNDEELCQSLDLPVRALCFVLGEGIEFCIALIVYVGWACSWFDHYQQPFTGALLTMSGGNSRFLYHVASKGRRFSAKRVPNCGMILRRDNDRSPHLHCCLLDRSRKRSTDLFSLGGLKSVGWKIKIVKGIRTIEATHDALIFTTFKANVAQPVYMGLRWPFHRTWITLSPSRKLSSMIATALQFCINVADILGPPPDQSHQIVLRLDDSPASDPISRALK
jgi:hypothetical protein